MRGQLDGNSLGVVLGQVDGQLPEFSDCNGCATGWTAEWVLRLCRWMDS